MNPESLLALIRERIHHPSTPREMLQRLKIPARGAGQLQAAPDRPGRERRPDRDPRQPLRAARPDEPGGRPHHHPPARLRLRRARPPPGRCRGRYLHRRQQPESGDARRPRRRPGRARSATREPRAASCASSSAARAPSSGATTWTPSGFGFVVPFDRRMIMDVQIPPEDRGEARAVRHGAGRDHPLADRDARPARARQGSARRHRRAWRRHRDHHPQVRHSGRALRGRGRRSDRGSAPRSSQRDLERRTDFRPQTTVTIDGEHARDFDDAITLDRLPNGAFRLGVHIADVAHYVRRGQRARRRGLRARHLGVFPRPRGAHVPRRSCPPDCAASSRTSTGWSSRA